MLHFLISALHLQSGSWRFSAHFRFSCRKAWVLSRAWVCLMWTLMASECAPMSTGSDFRVTASSSDLLPSTPSFLAFNCHNVDLVFEELSTKITSFLPPTSPEISFRFPPPLQTFSFVCCSSLTTKEANDRVCWQKVVKQEKVTPWAVSGKESEDNHSPTLLHQL